MTVRMVLTLRMTMMVMAIMAGGMGVRRHGAEIRENERQRL
jgi:hypothetical protein